MKFNSSKSYQELIGHQTFLYGETNTKKTYYTAKFIQFLLESRHLDPKEISILDFAPPQSSINNIKIGGKIKDFYKNSIKCNNFSFEGDIIPPRLKAKNIKELYDNACKNFKRTFRILNSFNGNPTSILIINDISIYLHIGNKNLLLKAIKITKTFFGNSYYGSSIKSDFTNLISRRENRIVEYLAGKLEYSYFTG